MKGRAMTEGTPWKHILIFMMPVMLGSLLQQLYSTVDNIIVGNYLGEDALAAVGTTGSFIFLCMALAIGLSAGSGVVVAQAFGAGNKDLVRRNASTGIIMLMGIGVIVTILALIFARPAYQHLFSVPENILDMTVQYFTIYALGFIFQFGYNIFSGILRAVGDSAATLYFLLISSIMNIGLDLLFVAVFNWGVVGAAVATDISQLASFAAAYIYMIRKYPVFRFRLREYTWEGSLAKRTFQFGFPIALQLMIVSFGLSLIQRAVNEFGKTMIASFTVGHRMEMYISLPCNALQTTMATYTGQNVGARKLDRVKKGAVQSLVISFIMTAIICVLFWLLAPQITGLFGISDQSAVYCIEHLKTIAITNIIFAMYLPLFGVFQGSNHPTLPTVVAVFALGIRVAVVFLLRYSDIFGYRIIWWNGLFGYGVGFLIVWFFFFSGLWKKNAIKETRADAEGCIFEKGDNNGKINKRNTSHCT